MFSRIYEIEEHDLEARYRHVHHAHAVRLLERARLDYLTAISFPLEDLIARDIYLVITAIQVRYKRELFAGPVRITCEEPRIEGKGLILNQRILRNGDKLAVEAVIESQCMLGATKRAVPPPDDLRAAFIASAQ